MHKKWIIRYIRCIEVNLRVSECLLGCNFKFTSTLIFISAITGTSALATALKIKYLGNNLTLISNIWYNKFWTNMNSRKIKCSFREHQQKAFVMLSRFWQFKGVGGLSESIKKGQNLCWKSFFEIIMNEVLKTCEKWHLLM